MSEPRAGRWRPGEVVVLRERWRGRVWSARPAIVVRDDPEQRTFYVPGGSPWRHAAGPQATRLRLPSENWSLAEFTTGGPVLSFAWPGAGYAVLVFWRGTLFTGYYVNLQTPLEPTAIGFDTTDHLLDVLVSADRATWRWKDEDELEEAVAGGLFTPEDAAAIRREGLRAVEHLTSGRPPFDRDWSDWAPDPAWPERVALPPGWDAPAGAP